MDVDIAEGPYYGAARLWPEATAPHMSEREALFVTAADSRRFVEGLVKAAQFQADQPLPTTRR